MKQPIVRRPRAGGPGLAALAALLLAAGAAAAQQPVPAAPEPRPVLERPTSIGVDYSLSRFADDTDPWHLASVSLGRRTALGSLIARGTYGNRFGNPGSQFEVDAYPRLPGIGYAYLNAGVSPAGPFPDVRFGAELFASLPAAWEASLGMRHLRFDPSRVTLYTGSIGKYSGNYWISARSYARPKDGGLSASGSLTMRRYFVDGDDYVGASIGYGSAPGDRVDASELDRANSFSAGVQTSRPVGRTLIATGSLGYDREELTFGRVRSRVEASLGAKFRF